MYFITGQIVGVRKMYQSCKPKPPNYPVTGLALSAGAIHIIESIFNITDRDTSDSIFRYYLAFFDSLNFLLFIWLAKLMRFRFSRFDRSYYPNYSIHLGRREVAVWAQIDGISLFFCLLSVIGFFKSWVSE